MVQPPTSLTGSFIRMLPLSVLYASSKVVKSGFSVHILDARINPASWKKDLDALVTHDTRIVGISVMSGLPVLEGLKISRHIKKSYPSISVVWGGPHPTFSPEKILEESSIDFAVRGYGVDPFHQLVLHLSDAPEALSLHEIRGLSFKNADGSIHHNDVVNTFELIDYRQIPYHLVDVSNYRHLDTTENVFPIYSVMGCPYQCGFCSSPAQYSKMQKKWLPLPLEEILGHIQMLRERFEATFIYFIDDDSFVDLQHVEAIIDGIKRLGIQVKLGFRGVRIDEIDRMTPDFLKKLAEAGTSTMHIGIESGCDRILAMMKKNITSKQSIGVNQKLAKVPEIRVLYNFIVGFPTETLEETKMTRDLILRLIKDNPRCCVIPLNKPRPLPGTDLHRLALAHGYKPPTDLEEWGNYDVESSDYRPPWLSAEHHQFIRMMFLCMYFIDDKIHKLSEGGGMKFLILKTLARLYKPVAMFRFKNGFYKFLIEDHIYTFLKHRI